LPAIRRSGEERPLPEILVADSSFLFAATYDAGDGLYDRSSAFARALREAGTVLVLSPLVYLEASQCWRRLFRLGLLQPTEATGDPREDRKTAFQEANRHLNTFLGLFETYTVEFSQELAEVASIHVAEYNLRSHDALFVALSTVTRVSHLVAFDSDFRRVDGLTLWEP